MEHDTTHSLFVIRNTFDMGHVRNKFQMAGIVNSVSSAKGVSILGKTLKVPASLLDLQAHASSCVAPTHVQLV